MTGARLGDTRTHILSQQSPEPPEAFHFLQEGHAKSRIRYRNKNWTQHTSITISSPCHRWVPTTWTSHFQSTCSFSQGYTRGNVFRGSLRREPQGSLPALVYLSPKRKLQAGPHCSGRPGTSNSRSCSHPQQLGLCEGAVLLNSKAVNSRFQREN